MGGDAYPTWEGDLCVKKLGVEGLELRTLVEDLNGNFVALALPADDILFGDLEVIKVEGAG